MGWIEKEINGDLMVIHPLVMTNNFANLKMAIEMVDLPIKISGFPLPYLSLPEGTTIKRFAKQIFGSSPWTPLGEATEIGPVLQKSSTKPKFWLRSPKIDGKNQDDQKTIPIRSYDINDIPISKNK